MSDSRPETWEHINHVRRYLNMIITDLMSRAELHDLSKLATPEIETFDEYTDKLSTTVYGSEDYFGYLAAMQPALVHHYAHNEHHPQFHDNGVGDMHLGQLVEMLCDWKAATLRNKNGDLRRSIVLGRERFGYGEEIERLLLNTAEAFGWVQ